MVTMRALSQQGHGPGDKDVAGYNKKGSKKLLPFFVPSTVNLYGKARRTVQISSVQEIANNPVYLLCTRLSGNTRRQGERCAVIRGCYREIKE